MYALLERAGVYQSSFTGEAEGTIFREGQRNIGLAYLATVQVECADEFMLMLKERKDDVDRDRAIATGSARR
jgi:hypothetical protein